MLQELVQRQVQARGLLWARVRALEPVRTLQERQSRRRSQERQSLGSSWHHASTGLRRFSKLHQTHCASCEFLERQPLMQKLQQPGMRRFCLV